MTTAHLRHGAPRSANWSWAFWGAAIGLALALLTFAPARWMAVWVQGVSNGQLNLIDARGTVWAGSSRLVLTGGVGSLGGVALPGRLSWQLRPAFGGFSLRASAPCCMAQAIDFSGQVRWGGFALAVADHLSNWPAGLLAGLGTPWNTIAAEGNLSVSSKGLSLEWAEGRISMKGTLQIDAQEMASRLTTLNPVGTYRLLVDGGSPIAMSIQTLEGSLQLSGAGKWVGGRLRFEGAASAAPERLDALSNLLNIIGLREGARSIIKVG